MTEKRKQFKVKRNLRTKASREYWAFIERVAAEVDKWPAWKRGDVYRRGESE